MLRVFRSATYAPGIVRVLTGFALGLFLVRALVPPPREPGLEEAWQRFRAVHAEVELLFLGSSRVKLGIDAALCEQELARAGSPLRVHVLAVDGLRTFEQDRLLRAVLADPPPRLRWILAEFGPIGVALPEHHEFRVTPALYTTRSVRWHDPPTTARVLRALVPLPLPLGERLELARAHLAVGARNVLNLGRWSAHLSRARARSAPRPAASLAHLSDTPAHARWLARIVAQNELPIELSELDSGFHRAQLAAARARGIRLVHVAYPAGEGAPEAFALLAAGRIDALLAYCDPRTAPELFEPEHRSDGGHLGPSGARLLSTRIARDLGLRLAESDGG